MRREYVDGFVYAHAGASLPHNRIAANLGRVLLNATRGGPC
ncbi:Uma2 family endonuclease [Deinococcus aestuarii]|nr:Uma2 family endonuclease [Deinococcus aestuarii]